MWVYRQSTGEFQHNGQAVATGYSGAGDGKNRPDLQNIRDVGPIPQGWYVIGAPHDTPGHGPYVLGLTPLPENSMFGRAGFLIHGDSLAHAGTASEGCIVVSRSIREQIWNSGDTQLTVMI
jgi:hypothetical protein